MPKLNLNLTSNQPTEGSTSELSSRFLQGFAQDVLSALIDPSFEDVHVRARNERARTMTWRRSPRLVLIGRVPQVRQCL